MSCYDPWKHRDEGRDAARFGRRFDSEHRERMDNARYGDPYNCDVYYAEGYEREIRRREEERALEEERERAEERAFMEREAERFEEAIEQERQEIDQENF